jgi:hypothetical protein
LWAVYIIVGLIALVIIILSIPIEAVIKVDTTEKPKLRLKLTWLFGLVKQDLVRRKEKLPDKEKPEKEKKKTKPDFGLLLEIIRTEGLLKKAVNLVKDIVGNFEIRELDGEVRIGFDDPADAGLAYSLIGVFTPLLGRSTGRQLKVQPYFSDEVGLEGYLDGSIRLYPASLFGPLSRFFFSRPGFRITRIMVFRKWKKKR